MSRIPFDTDAIRVWSDWEPTVRDDNTLIISKFIWSQIVSDVLAAADEIELLMAERVKDAA